MAKIRFNDKIALLCIFLIACVLVIPIAFMGIPDGFDLLQHIRFANTYLDSFLNGQIIPSWGGNDNFGFGSIGVRFYPPLVYILLALTKLLAGGWYDAFWIDALLWMSLGGVGVYLWAREWMDVTYALLAALLYSIAPYHTFQIYGAVLFAEFAAAGIIPFCFLYLTRLSSKGDVWNTLLFSISLSLLFLTHIPSAMIGSVCLALYAMTLTERARIFSTLLRFAWAYLLALAATAFHWIKLVTEVDWVKHNSPAYFSNGAYDFQRYFFPIYLITPAANYIEKRLWEYDFLVSITTVFFLPSLIFLAVKLRSRAKTHDVSRPQVALFATGVFSIFMLSLASSLIWQYVSILQKIQFPWRWLLVATAAGPICFVIVLSYLNKASIRRMVIYTTAAFVLIVGLYSVTQNIFQSNPLTRLSFDKEVSEMDSTTACECWWPIWANQNALAHHERVEAAARAIEVNKWSSNDRTFTIGPGTPGNGQVATFWYPYWKATINGSTVGVGLDQNGALLIPLPAERSEVHLYFEEPSFVAAAKYISLLAWIAIVAGLVIAYRTSKVRQLDIAIESNTS